MIIEIPQLGLSLEAKPGDNLLTVLSLAHVPIARSCGGDGICGTCHITIEGDHIPSKSIEEQRLAKRMVKVVNIGINSEERFACLIRIPESSKKWVIKARYW